MSSKSPAAPNERLLHDLVSGLSMPGAEPTLSVGILGSAGHAPQPPEHCLRTCLDGDRTAVESRGCAFLQSAARNEVDRGMLADGRCPKGYHVATQDTAIGGAPATLLTIEGVPVSQPAEAAEPTLLGHLSSASRLVQHIGQLLEENAGFANEVLQNYEQLNLIFDLTQQVAQVTDARAIETLLAQRVARLLGADTVCIMSGEDRCRAYGAESTAGGANPPALVHDPAVSATVAQVRKTRQVQVAQVADQRVIAGPLVRLDEQVDVVLAIRPLGGTTFNSGDMMLIESMLTFGGQILSNTELHERMRQMSLEVTRAMVAAIDKKDHYTCGHSERCGFLTQMTAQEMRVPLAEQQFMEWAGLLHDVGKIGIPEEILCKPGKLTAEEFEIIKQHPWMGYEILKPIASLKLILDGVLYHHEYPDGSGYPKGLRGDEIPLVARIIHVADTFDALTSTRSYREAFSIERALEIISEEKGRRIDTEVAEAFIRAFAAYRQNDPDDFAIRFARVHEREFQNVES